ncbi:MAG: ribonuclease H-like domain-containing protein [Chloroflexota bacterium]
MDAYLDIETTGLSPSYAGVTVIGVYLVGDRGTKFHQLIGETINRPAVLRLLEGVQTIYTYNGSRFDLPFLEEAIGVDLTQHFEHHDLMYDCWECNLYGGLKAVERQLHIKRQLPDVDGYMAVVLWWRYLRDGDVSALRTLLKYNKEDVLNLRALREKLGAMI